MSYPLHYPSNLNYYYTNPVQPIYNYYNQSSQINPNYNTNQMQLMGNIYNNNYNIQINQSNPNYNTNQVQPINSLSNNNCIQNNQFNNQNNTIPRSLINNNNNNNIQKTNVPPEQYNNKNNNLNNLNQNNNNQNSEKKGKSEFIYDDEALIDKLENEKDQEIGFDMNLLNRDKLNVNLIHFDSNITKGENYKYYNKFKVDVVGGYIAMDTISKLTAYLEVLKKLDIPFIVLSSGSSGKDVIQNCRNYPFIKEVIIFCGNISENQYYLQQYPGYVKTVFNNIGNIYKYIKSFGSIYVKETKKFKNKKHFIFSPEDIEMKKQLEQCPVISAYEYDNCYFLVHRAYAHFFRNNGQNVAFTNDNFNKIKKYINESNVIQSKYKQELIQQFESLVNRQNFVELAIRLYTKESYFCYIFNRTMRNFDEGLISLAYFMGPFLYALNKYVKENPHLGFNKNMTLYRKIICSELDYYLYKINQHHIICFPSITSTSIEKIIFNPTRKNKEINGLAGNSQTLYNITMIFNYKHEPDNISPGILILNNKGKDNKYLSNHYRTEKEAMLFPFTFARITRIREVVAGYNEFEIYFDIINRKGYIENALKDTMDKRIKFDDLDKIINNKFN